jgi:hypothetical protein
LLFGISVAATLFSLPPIPNINVSQIPASVKCYSFMRPAGLLWQAINKIHYFNGRALADGGFHADVLGSENGLGDCQQTSPGWHCSAGTDPAAELNRC